MANIIDKVKKIREAIYGKDVRENIASGIEAINEEVKSTTGKQDLLETEFDQLIINAGNSNAEIVQARVDLTGNSYPNLKERMDNSDAQFEKTKKKMSYIEKQQTYISAFQNKLIKGETVSIGAYGDSLTYGYDIVSLDKRANSVTDNAGNVSNTTIASTTYPEALQETLNKVYGVGKVTVVTRAIGGDYAKRGLERWLPKQFPIGTDICIMNYGVNDSRLESCPYAGDTTEFLKYYRELIETEIDNGTGIILMTPFKMRTTDIRVQVFETAIINLAKEYEIPVIIGDEMLSNLSYKYYSDYTHLNGQGYKILGTKIANCFVGNGIFNPNVVSENTQLLTRRQLDGIWWNPNDTDIANVSSEFYPTPDESVDGSGIATRIGLGGTVYYTFYAEKDLWIAPFIGFNEDNSVAEVKLNFGIDTPDYTFDNFPKLGDNTNFTNRAYSMVEYTKVMPKISTRIHAGSILVDKLPCLRTVTKGWHTVSVTAKGGSIGLGGLIFLDASYFETIRNKYTKFLSEITVEPEDSKAYSGVRFVREGLSKRIAQFGSHMYGDNPSCGMVLFNENSEVLNSLYLADSHAQIGSNLRIVPTNPEDATSFGVRRSRDGIINYCNYGLFHFGGKLASGVSLMSDTSTELNRLNIGESYFAPSEGGVKDLGSSTYKFKDIYSTNGIIQTSDRNEKHDIFPSDLGLDFINKLSPVKYKYNIGGVDENLNPLEGVRNHYGFIAQDVETLLENDFAGLVKGEVVNEETNESKESYSLRYTEFIAPMVKAIQELTTKIEMLENRLNNNGIASKEE